MGRSGTRPGVGAGSLPGCDRRLPGRALTTRSDTPDAHGPDTPEPDACAERRRVAALGNRLARLIGDAAGLAGLCLSLAFTFDILLRWTVSQPILDLYEVSELAFAGVMDKGVGWNTSR